MLSGLIFATEDADDRADTLAATLPFGGSTLIEYQARLLAAVGVTHLLVAVGRVTPALLGALNRIGGRGVAVDVVRSAEEAAAKAHPLAQMIVFADSLVTTDAVVDWMASEHHEAVLVAQDGDGTPGVERVDNSHSWAGLARVPAARLTDVARMPSDYDFQSTLLRHSVQAGAVQLVLPPGTGRTRHGVERNAAALLRRSQAVLAALGDRRTAWIDRLLFTPLTGLTLPHLVARGMPTAALLAIAALATLGTAALLWMGWSWAGLLLAVIGCATLATSSMLSWLRGEDALARVAERAVGAVAAVAVLFLGLANWWTGSDGAPLVLAIGTIALVALVERVPAPKQRWWATPAAIPVLLLPFAVLGWPALGLAAVTGYALVTLAAAIEASRAKA